MIRIKRYGAHYWRTLILLILSVVLALFQHARALGDVGVIAPNPNQAHLEPKAMPVTVIDSQTDAQLLLYLRQAPSLARAREQQRTESYRNALHEYEINADKLTGHEADITAVIRQHATASTNHILSLEQFPDDGDFINASSAISAKICGLINSQHLIDDDTILSAILAAPVKIDPAWISIVDRIANASTAQPTKLMAFEILCRAGVESEPEREYVEQEVVGNNDQLALHFLLFYTDKNGLDAPAISMRNLRFLRNILKKNATPAVQVVCAEYLLSLRYYVDAEQLLRGIIAMPYINANGAQPTPADADLMRAQIEAQHLLFFGLENEDAFRIEYSIAYPDRLADGSLDTSKVRPGVASGFQTGRQEHEFQSGEARKLMDSITSGGENK